MKNRKSLLLPYVLLITGCTDQKDDNTPSVEKNKAPIEAEKTATKKSDISPQKPIVPGKIKFNKASSDDFKIPQFELTKTPLVQLKKEVYQVLHSKTYHPDFVKRCKELWPQIEWNDRRRLLKVILSTGSLSKAHMGRKPYHLESLLLQLKLNQQEQVYLLQSLKSNQEPNIKVAKNYLSSYYHKNFGSNYYEWHQTILKNP